MCKSSIDSMTVVSLSLDSDVCLCPLSFSGIPHSIYGFKQYSQGKSIGHFLCVYKLHVLLKVPWQLT